MSDDLISRRNLIIRLKNGSVIPFSKMLLNDKHKQILEFEDMVKTQPAAYDVEKVIQQLEKWAAEYEKADGSDRIEDAYFKGLMRGYLNSIEIVKSGGIAVGQKGERHEAD